MNELSDRYLCEGSHDQMMMDALKELNIEYMGFSKRITSYF